MMNMMTICLSGADTAPYQAGALYALMTCVADSTMMTAVRRAVNPSAFGHVCTAIRTETIDDAPKSCIIV